MGPVQVARQPTDQGAVSTAPVSRHGGPGGLDRYRPFEAAVSSVLESVGSVLLGQYRSPPPLDLAVGS
jgi:hypothetical protein